MGFNAISQHQKIQMAKVASKLLLDFNALF